MSRPIRSFCYTGTNVGDDTITGSVGTLSDTASKRWGAGGGTPANVPTLSEWAFLALAVMLSVVAARSLGRGRRHSA